jgi:hypothetical protein
MLNFILVTLPAFIALADNTGFRCYIKGLRGQDAGGKATIGDKIS